MQELPKDMMNVSPVTGIGEPLCEFCYSDHKPGWNARLVGPKPLEWHFYICDHCRLLLRDTISVVLHKLTHGQVVAALLDKMQELGVSYEDLMGVVKQKAIEGPADTNS